MLFCFKSTRTTESYTYGHTLALHDALPIVPSTMTHGGAISKRSATRYKTPQNLRKYETDFSVLLSKISAVLAALHFQKYTILWVGVTPWFAQRSNNGKMTLVTSPPDQKLGELTHIITGITTTTRQRAQT